jgi:hypothetical protein
MKIPKQAKQRVKKEAVNEEQLKLAKRALKDARKSGAKLSIREAAQQFKCNKDTLRRRMQGAVSKSAAHRHQMLLKPTEEETLHHYLVTMADLGTPVTPNRTRTRANNIMLQRDPASKRPGRAWAEGFERRHPEIITARTTSLERARADGMSPETAQQHFAKLKELFDSFPNLPASNVFNIDEKGVMMGRGGSQLAYVRRGIKQKHQIDDGNRESVTVVECVSAAGDWCRPLVIFRAEKLWKQWVQNNPGQAHITV